MDMKVFKYHRKQTSKQWLTAWAIVGLLMAFSPLYAKSPPATMLASPSGSVGSNSLTYTWNAVSSASWYYLWVNDSSGNAINQWYQASEVGCASGSGMCSATPGIALNQGAGRWWIQTWNSDGYGPWSNAMSFDVGASPSTAVLIAPQGRLDIGVVKPRYSWNAVAGASWYYLWVNDSSGNVIRQWYRSSEVGCKSGSGTCSVMPTTRLAKGTVRWWIQTWNSDGYGPWSNAMTFFVDVFPPQPY
jgi:hypothetical protein